MTQQSHSRKTLLLVAAVSILPIVASYLLYFFWRPESTMNYGQLISPRPLPTIELKTLDGKAFDLSSLKGRWILLQLDEARCDSRCEQKLFFMRQVRKAQGEHQDRIERVWLVLDDGMPAKALLDAIDGTHVLRAGAMVAALPGDTVQQAHIFLIDPLGQVMLRYPENPDPKRMIKDLQRLMKYSRLG